MRILAALALLALSSAVTAQTSAPPVPDLSRLSEDHRAALRCAAAFAIVATVQSGGESLAGWPPLSVRGKRFFADAGVAVMREAGIDRAAVRDLIAGEVRALQTAAEPDAALAALAKPCTVRLDAAVSPLVTPGLRQCAAIMTLAYDEIYAREGLSAAARDLKTLASVLSAREREALIAAGKTGGEADRAMAETREAIAAEAGDGKGGIDKYEVAHCYTLAKPDEKTHY
ncbi:hypothetical protein [Novosphingobium sp. AAP83]|uniref:hypothetical protein n=1 Tax=Novosphingobium sp. AAP83 TaxID=1523425 RepID=UPI0006B91CD3|nr:hypothetical protein [Novosphingobium sp. AAP83]